ncbi:hypothetical protein NF418_03590 [Streptococcus suis]|uniref:hypothetical protein n=1 Tax=Streptococcus suis TaxID=1307 RepID=UPI0021190A1B|nr:hypothetical protein [Streptococcus suis]
MSLTPSIRRNKEVQALQTIASPYQMEVARKLSQNMADNQARELLATDILYKVGNLLPLTVFQTVKAYQPLR